MDSEWTNGFVNSNGFDLFYTRTGGDKPPIVLAHGYTDDGLCWTDVARLFETDYDVIMVDAIGHGRSARITADMPLDMVADMHNVIISLNLDKPLIMGHSMGAATAAGYAALHPKNVSAIILEDVPWFNELPAPKKETKKEKPKDMIGELQKGTLEQAITFSRGYNPRFAETVHKVWAESKMRWDLTFQKRKWSEMPRWQEIAKLITYPTLLLTGDVDKGALVTPQVAVEALKIMPKAQWAHIPNAPHCIRYEQFNITMSVIKNFLKFFYPPKATK